jgi:hypothetical protein
VPAHAARACHVVAGAWRLTQLSALKVIELYQGLVRPFQRCEIVYELRCGQLYTCTMAVLADPRYVWGQGNQSFA